MPEKRVALRNMVLIIFLAIIILTVYRVYNRQIRGECKLGNIFA